MGERAGVWHAAKDLRPGLEPGSAAYVACALITWPPAHHAFQLLLYKLINVETFNVHRMMPININTLDLFITICQTRSAKVVFFCPSTMWKSSGFNVNIILAVSLTGEGKCHWKFSADLLNVKQNCRTAHRKTDRSHSERHLEMSYKVNNFNLFLWKYPSQPSALADFLDVFENCTNDLSVWGLSLQIQTFGFRHYLDIHPTQYPPKTENVTFYTRHRSNNDVNGFTLE